MVNAESSFDLIQPTKLAEKVKAAVEETNNAPHGMTRFQIEHFVVGQEPTKEGQYVQCLKELEARAHGIRSITIKVEKFKLDLEAQSRKIEDLKSMSDAEFTTIFTTNRKTEDLLGHYKDITLKKEKLREIEIQISLEEMQRSFENAKREFVIIAEILDKLKEELGKVDWETAQSDYWNARLLGELQIRLRSGNSIPPDLLKTILSMPKESTVLKATEGVLYGGKHIAQQSK